MPYRNINELPDRVKVLPSTAQRQFLEVANSQLERGLSESRAFASAWSVIRRKYRRIDNVRWVEKSEKEDDMEQTQLTIPITKIDEEKRMVFGWASIAITKDGQEVIDTQDDVLDVPSLEDAVYAYVQDSRDGGEMHTKRGVATLCESVFFTTEKLEAMGLEQGAMPEGWWVGFVVSEDHPEVWDAVKSGKYASFSIGGMGLREAYEEAS